MTETSIFDEIPEEISRHLVSFSEVIDDIESFVNQYAKQQKENDEPRNVLEGVKAELSLCYAFNALFFVYLRCNGVQTNSHPIMQELNRVMDAMKRCRALTEKATTAQLRPDKEAASRFIKHALWQSAHSKAKKRRTETEEGSSR